MGGKALKKRKKKAASYVLASALVLSNLGFTASVSAESGTPKDDFAAKVKQLQDLASKDFKNISSSDVKGVADLKPTDKVRVIVELEGQTPVEYATKQGKLYKELSEDKKNSLDVKVATQQKR